MPRINLLPWREAERKRKRQEFFLSLGAALATAGLITLLGNWQMSSAIDHQRERNDYLTQEIAGLDKQIEEINGLDAQKSRLLARMEIIETLQRSRPEIVHVFDELVRVLPEGVYLTYLKQTGTRFELRGVAQSSTRVSSFMRKIDASSGSPIRPCRSSRRAPRVRPAAPRSSRCLPTSGSAGHAGG